MIEYSIKVHGRVQGVGYRAFAHREAANLNLSGTVRNTADGGVEVVAQGEPETLQKFIAKLREGPRAAKVFDIDITEQSARSEYRSFEVKPSEY
jgi:acylphosphatase